jgi:hypothetical protein
MYCFGGTRRIYPESPSQTYNISIGEKRPSMPFRVRGVAKSSLEGTPVLCRGCHNRLTFASSGLREHSEYERAKTASDVTVPTLLDLRMTHRGAPITESMSWFLLAWHLSNYAAHDLTPQSVLVRRYGEIIQALMNVLFLTVECLARSSFS